jgi:hypothetical protein
MGLQSLIARFAAAVAFGASTAGTVGAQTGMFSPNSPTGLATTPSTVALNPPTTLTVEAWYYFNTNASGGGNNPTIVRNGSASYILRTNSGGGGNLQWIVWTASSGSTTVQSPSAAPLNGWHHVAGTYDGANVRLYLNGVQIASAPKTGVLSSPGSTPFLIGTGQDTSETWKGWLDEIRVWNVARTQPQIAGSRFARLDAVPGLSAAWHFDGNYLDYTGGHHAVPAGTLSIVSPSTSPVPAVYLLAPVSSPVGSPLVYQLFMPPNAPYLFDVSFAGTAPGIPLPAPATGVFPLNPPYLNLQFGPYYPGVFTDFAAFGDSFGFAQPTAAIPALPFLVGTPLSGAFFVIDPTKPLAIGSISNGVSTTLTAPAPAVASISPPTSPAAGGWPVTILGSDFLPGAVVRIAGVPAVGVNVVSSTEIACSTPAGAVGPATVEVVNPDGNAATLGGAFSYVATLTIQSVAPLVPTPGALVTVTGAGIQPGATATLGATPVAAATTSTSLTFVAPSGVPCGELLTIANPDGQSVSTGVNPSPVIGSVQNSSGPAIGGGLFVLFGSNFLPGVSVTIGGVAATVASHSSTVLFGYAPPGTPGPATLTVTSASGCSASAPYAYY